MTFRTSDVEEFRGFAAYTICYSEEDGDLPGVWGGWVCGGTNASNNVLMRSH